MQGKSLLQREPLGVPHRGISLTNPLNPIIFLDIQCPKYVSGVNSVSDEPPYRFMFEIFADLAPILAANIVGLSIGSSTRLIDQRPQPAGYKGTILHDTLVGQYIIGGDVMNSAGNGFFSAIGERQGPLQIPTTELEALISTAPSRCLHFPGIYMQYWNYNSEIETATAVTRKVASTFRMDIISREENAGIPKDAILIGRMVHRETSKTQAESATQLLNLSKAIFHAKRSTTSQSLFPTIVLCGEM